MPDSNTPQQSAPRQRRLRSAASNQVDDAAKTGSDLPPEAPLAQQPPAPEEMEQTARHQLGGSHLHQHDVVQITSKESRLYGVFFIIGDVRGRQVHGYYIMEGRSKQYVTIDIDMVQLIGEARIRSATPCSQKWLSDNQ